MAREIRGVHSSGVHNANVNLAVDLRGEIANVLVSGAICVEGEKQKKI